MPDTISETIFPMHGRRWGRLASVVFAGVAVVAAAIWAAQRNPAPTPNPQGSFAFAALGDAPYDRWEERRFRVVLRDMDAHALSWIVHVGDIFESPCTDDHYRTALDRFNGLRHPVVYTPGDNEWTDCWLPGSGSFAPRERLTSLRKIFFADPHRSLGGRRVPVRTQADDRQFGEFVENLRWSHAGVTFATVHLPGSRNGLRPFPKRTAADDEEVQRRTEAAAAWLRASFAEAKAARAPAVVLAFHGTLGLGQPAEGRLAYEPFAAALEEEVERFGKPVLAVHGDAHKLIIDYPLVRRTTGRWLANLTRLEVPGSPDVGWVRVVVTPGAAQPFTFQPLIVSRWRFW
jgi:hypothetical protein